MSEKNIEFYIIEDDAAVAEVLKDIVEDYDLGRISGISDGTGISTEEILGLDPDVILVDFLMPEKDGVQVVKELKAAGCEICLEKIRVKDVPTMDDLAALREKILAL
jgi:two-component system response regulator YcbB